MDPAQTSITERLPELEKRGVVAASSSRENEDRRGQWLRISWLRYWKLEIITNVPLGHCSSSIIQRR